MPIVPFTGKVLNGASGPSGWQRASQRPATPTEAKFPSP